MVEPVWLVSRGSVGLELGDDSFVVSFSRLFKIKQACIKKRVNTKSLGLGVELEGLILLEKRVVFLFTFSY